MAELTPQRVANNLQMLETEVRYLRGLVGILLEGAPAPMRQKALEYVRFMENQPPRITTVSPQLESATIHSSRVAADWVSILRKG
ncbi:hypothetical protein MSKU15_1257 [Komagataeibacter diospyri]|uniref:Uncharacterized protein n=1 Tax=Komagataeibacter diospyri TaxID=1932662 RepID=A0A4P5NN77_9PROT|nr:hypothetical protein MSKU9_1179 [Komagataeibacter diospyri]GCE89656.1 hypothetical protein MSKU15_1257 [Komagataeibacter diospyri]